MGSRKGITGALVGLVLLVLLGWLTNVVGSDDTTGTAAGPSGSTAVIESNGAGSGTVRVPPSRAPQSRATADASAERALSELPQQAAQTWALIEKGGPFPYPRNDGVTFQNREGRLPRQASGYYKEYTVPTPGSPDRGARRLVTGADSEVFYTDDHYDSFVTVDTSR